MKVYNDFTCETDIIIIFYMCIFSDYSYSDFIFFHPVTLYDPFH